MIAFEEMTEVAALGDDERWSAVVAKDVRYDGRFVTAVHSTHIYCRPTCTARLPRRENVSFFADCASAEQAGFRACRRCLPNTPGKAVEEVALVQRIAARIVADDGRRTLAELGADEGFSPQHLQRIFRRVMGVTPRQYAEACRVERMKARLKEGEAVTDALYDVGYGSSSRLYERADDHFGMTPATYKRGGAGAHITYTIVDCALGRLLVAATGRGVCMVVLRDNDAELEEALRAEFPAATLKQDGADVGEWVAALVRHLHGDQPHLDLPLDVQATAFQWRVWQELRAIPYGSTRSYTDVAQAIGNPKAVRAVARACATNPVAVIIPCHRVVRENGDLAGYRWGIERKRALLAQEAERI